ncbi:MAG: restriction endonuclease subunit S [Methylotenera sp.]
MAGKYQAYPEYKNSGIDLLGDIPACWSLSRHKYIARFQKGKNPEVLLDTPNEGSIRYLSMDYLRGNTDALFADVEQSSYVSKKDQVLIIWDGSNAGEFVKGQEGIVSSTMAACELLSDINPGFYWYSCICLEPEMRKHANGMGIPHVNGNELKNGLTLLPSKEEQEKIASFLDHETAKIDTLIGKQQQLIKLLKEKRQAVISHAVTKGINPNAPMRDSGVEWLGEVPAHWEVRAVSKLSQKITNGYVGPTRDILLPEGVPYVQATHIKNGKVNFDDAYFVKQSWSESHAKSILVKGDVLIVQTGAGTGDIGLVTENEEGFNCHALIIVQAKKDIAIGDYVSMVFQSQYGCSVLYSIRTGGMHPHLNCGEVQFVKLPVPPLDEQDHIVEYISQQIYKFDALVERQLKAIELMKERRTALISAAVTGKIDVRNWQAPAI